jgi:outer membrane protein OmpA-like peptidoglycan-associated protein
MGHSSACASASAVLTLLGGLLLATTANAQSGGGSVSVGGSLGASTGAQGTAQAAPAAAGTAQAPPAAAPAAPEAVPDAPEAPPPEADEAAQAAEWAARDRAVNESNTITGGTGLLHTQHAQTGAPGQFRLGFVAEWFKAGFLCTDKFPCPNPNGGAPITSDTLSHTGGTVSLGASLFPIGAGTFDGYVGLSAIANSDAANRPALLQVLGDTDFGIKYMAPVGDVIHLGLFTELWLINGTGSVGLDGGGTSAKFGGVATADLRGDPASSSSHIPLRFSANVVYSLDNTGAVLQDTEAARGAAAGVPTVPVTRIERYGLAVNRVDHFDFLLGGEVFIADDRVRPFVEGHILTPNNRQNYACHTNNVSQDNCLANDTVVPATLTIGSRFFTWKRGFSLLAAFDIGLGGTHDFIEELQPTPPWTLFLGGGWAVDTWDRPPVVKKVERVIEKGIPRAHVVGFVHEKDKNDPIVGAIATYRDHPDMSPLATGADGKFGDEVAPGAYTYDITADGYKAGSCDANVPTAGAEVPIDCPLEALPRVGTVVGHVRDAETSQPISGIQVVMTDSQHKDLTLNTDASGGFRFEGVTPGTAELRVEADGYLVLVVPADVRARQESAVDLALRPKPKQPKVAVTAKEITIKEQIQFALDSAVILPESFGILTEIADTVIRHPEIKRLEVQGHTDNSGTPEHNQLLSEQRAEAVRAWLVQHGVETDRLVARGYGQERPLVPNVTAGNRAQNRRVQFIILEKEGSAPTAPASPGQPPPPPTPPKKNVLPGF